MALLSVTIKELRVRGAAFRSGRGQSVAFKADVAKKITLAAMVEPARRRRGRIDILHYDIGVSMRWTLAVL